jgi:hypothetical protein
LVFDATIWYRCVTQYEIQKNPIFGKNRIYFQLRALALERIVRSSPRVSPKIVRDEHGVKLIPKNGN